MSNSPDLATGAAPDDSMVFDAADALQIQLNLVKGVLKGFATREYSVGDLWTFRTDWVVESDVNTRTSKSFFIKFSGNLWAYLVSTGLGMWLIFFDGDRAKVRVGSLSAVATGNTRETLMKLKDAVRDGYTYNDQLRQWESLDVADILARIGRGNVQSTGSGTANVTG